MLVESLLVSLMERQKSLQGQVNAGRGAVESCCRGFGGFEGF